VDFHASFAALVGAELEADAALDSMNMLDALLGRSATGRQELVTEGVQARTVLRDGDWAFIPPHPGQAVSPTTGIELGNREQPQLFDLSQDLGQICDLATAEPERTARMTSRLAAIREGSRTRAE
jgi:hypothetical protein